MSESIYRVRQNVTRLSAEQKQSYINGVLKLKQTPLSKDPSIPKDDTSGVSNVYDWYAFTHDRSMTQIVHSYPWFLPWHRQFILNFESMMRIVLNDGTFALPYWDWAYDSGTNDPSSCPVWGIDLMGGDGTKPFRTDGDKAGDVTTGAFAVGKWTLNVQPTGGNPSTHLRRAFGNWNPNEAGKPPSQAAVDAALAITTYDTEPFDQNSTDSFRNSLELVHNLLHQWVGGSMMENTSPNDPVFFLHHCNLDRIWALWQDQNPTAHYLPADSPDRGATVPMWPWQTSPFVTPSDVWIHRSLGYVYDEPWPIFTPFAIPMKPIGLPNPVPVNNGPTVSWGGELFSSRDATITGSPGLIFNVKQQSLRNTSRGPSANGRLRLNSSELTNTLTQYFCLRGPGAAFQHPVIQYPDSNQMDPLQAWNGNAFVDGDKVRAIVKPIGPNNDCWFRRKPGTMSQPFSIGMQDGNSGNNEFDLWAYNGHGTPDA